MRVMIIGSLSGELGRAATMAHARGAEIEQADDATIALERLRRDAGFDLLLCDVALDVAALVRRLASERLAVAVVACGVDTDPVVAADSIRAGATEFLPLPPDSDLIAAILEAAAGRSHSLIARDPAMLALLRRAEQVARSDASVLITGESGTGKEVVARHIHRRSRRAAGPFVALNCAAIPEQLLESELFGHEKGAFSGAVARRLGKFESATGGTLLLDEISEMDVRLQAKLLRAIQEREIDRVGGTAPVRVDVRILATSNVDMGAHVAAGRFRADLFFRLAVVTLGIPSLRDRPADIPVLADHYARHFAELNGLAPLPIDPDAHRRLGAHAWPGNVRELQNTVHRAVLLAERGSIDADAIELSGARTRTGHGAGAAAGRAGDAPPVDSPADPIASLVGRSMDDVERALIIGTLDRTEGNRTHAATILGISIRALRNKLRDYAGQGVAVPLPCHGVVGG